MKHMEICIINVSVNLTSSWLTNEVDLISCKISVPSDFKSKINTPLELFKKLQNASQKQPSEVFCKKSCSKNFFNTHRNKTATQAFSGEHYEIYKNTYFEENLRTAASGSMRR